MAPATRAPDPQECATRLRRLRARLGLTQVRLAEQLGVSFVTVNRWENGQSRPSPLAWRRILRAEEVGIDGLSEEPPATAPLTAREDRAGYDAGVKLDFSSSPDAVWAVVEGERLAWGHLASPAFGTETALIDPLPHQHIAVYEHLLPQPRLRFLLADDAGAGKTIMVGLYLREMLSRRLIRRALIIPPAGLVGNWQSELRRLFALQVPIAEGGDARSGNPFLRPGSDLLIVSLDTMAGEAMFSRLQAPDVVPYDLVVFDEAHKLAADREPDTTLRKTERYKLAEAVAGVPSDDLRWQLPWRARHLILLTATPHMGKDYPYFCLWRLLEPEALPTPEAFASYPEEERRRHFVRRVKEEMVRYDGTPIYPARVSDTLSYELSVGQVSERALYDETTLYMRLHHNKAKMLNRSAVRLAMSVFQRRMASSTYALLRSLERHLASLNEDIDGIRSGRIGPQDLEERQRRLDQLPRLSYAVDFRPPDEESAADGREESELAEDEILGATSGTKLEDLEEERGHVLQLLGLARAVYERGQDCKFDRLAELLRLPQYCEHKLLIFTEFRDTLSFLVRRLEALGFTGQVVHIHGGMDYQERQAQIDLFRKPDRDGGARYLVATDAAGEGVNMQFCWLMVNYDVPWNPARLEQRLGRIHRYGQKHDPVVIVNLVAAETREGRVVKVLLEKLERIRQEMRSDKVFDVVGRLFAGVSIREYMEQALTEDGAQEAGARIEGLLTQEQVEAIRERERRLFGEGGDVRPQLPRLRSEQTQETYRRLLPGYVRRFVDRAAPLVGIGIDGDLDGIFAFRPLRPGALDALWPALETYPTSAQQRLTVYRPDDAADVAYVHPGEPVFDGFRALVSATFGPAALRGGVFVDPAATRPYLLHLAAVSAERLPDPALGPLARSETLECRLVGLRQEEDGEIRLWPVEYLLLLKGLAGIPLDARRLAVSAQGLLERARAYALDQVARGIADSHRQRLLGDLRARQEILQRGLDYQEADLLATRARLSERARQGDPRAVDQLPAVKQAQRALLRQRSEAIAVLRREPELIEPDEVRFVAHALVVPSHDPLEKERHDAQTEAIAVSVAKAFEETLGAKVQDVSKPSLAVEAGLEAYPGFDLRSVRPDGTDLGIEVKGRALAGEVELKENEWARACNLGDRYWLYVVYDCATPRPRLLRVQDPFGSLLVRMRGGVLIGEREIVQAAKRE